MNVSCYIRKVAHLSASCKMPLQLSTLKTALPKVSGKASFPVNNCTAGPALCQLSNTRELFENQNQNGISKLSSRLMKVDLNMQLLNIAKESPPVNNKIIDSVKKEIINPVKHIQIEMPRNNFVNYDVELPCNVERELIDPVDYVIEKHAHRMLIIRKRKMKVHQRKKRIRKNLFKHLEKLRKKAEMREKKTLDFVHECLTSAIKYDAKKEVAEKLQLARFKPPITRIRGFLCPNQVLKEHFENQAREIDVRKRVEKYLNKKVTK